MVFTGYDWKTLNDMPYAVVFFALNNGQTHFEIMQPDLECSIIKPFND